MRAVLALSVERYEEANRQRLARIRWLTGVLKLWDTDKHRSLSKFLRSRSGRTFRRRCAAVLTAK